MITRQRIVTFGIPTLALSTIALAAWLGPWAGRSLVSPPQPGPGPEPTPAGAHQIDVVFTIDTTGSMGGLIDGAKRTVWSIATHIKQADPQADLRIGLVAYRDLGQGDEYTTRDVPLTSDLDAAFAQLSTFRAAGGGDVPEDIAAGLSDALKMQWRDGAQKMVFIVGDAAPADRGEVPPLDTLARDAADRQIIVNTIRCGEDRDTEVSFAQVAQLGHGEFSTITQNGGVQEIATPYDEKMAELSAKIDHTAVIYATPTTRGVYEMNMAAAAAAPAPAAADRAEYYHAKGGKRAADDVLGDVEAGRVTIDGMDKAMLPADLQGLGKDELKAELDRRATERTAAQAELATVAKQRESYLKAQEAAGAAGGGPGAFDAVVKKTVDRELKK
jgi:hypothetical protein